MRKCSFWKNFNNQIQYAIRKNLFHLILDTDCPLLGVVCAAGLTPLEAATIKKETAIGIAQALADSKVQWVPQVMMGNGSGNNSAMDAVGLKMLMDIVDKMK